MNTQFPSVESERLERIPEATQSRTIVNPPQVAGTQIATESSVKQPPAGPIKALADLAKLMSDESRLKILFYLSQTEELHVRACCDLLEQSQPAVSHHLAMLKEAGLIEFRRTGKHNFYRLVPEQAKKFAELLFFAAPGGRMNLALGDSILSLRSESDAS